MTVGMCREQELLITVDAYQLQYADLAVGIMAAPNSSWVIEEVNLRFIFSG